MPNSHIAEYPTIEDLPGSISRDGETTLMRGAILRRGVRLREETAIPPKSAQVEYPIRNLPEGASLIDATDISPEVLHTRRKVRVRLAGGALQDALNLGNGTFLILHPNGSDKFPQRSTSGRRIFATMKEADRARANKRFPIGSADTFPYDITAAAEPTQGCRWDDHGVQHAYETGQDLE